ncbi:MAG TPA: sugar transferase [Deltaproteobacteria bacterium]|nr:sugar transferase [Deltaproteobacteria bacterium]
MFKTKRYLSPLVLVFCDAMAVTAAVYASFVLRITLNPFFTLQFDMEKVRDFFMDPLIIIVIWIFISTQVGSYNINTIGSFKNWVNTLKANVFTMVLLITLSFILKREELSRSLIVFFFLFNIPSVGLFRFLGLKVLSWFKEKGLWGDRIAILGTNRQSREIARLFEERGHLGSIFLGFVEMDGTGGGRPEEREGPGGAPVLGRIDEIEGVLARHGINMVIYVDKRLDEKELVRLVDLCDRRDVSFEVLPDLYNLTESTINFNEIAGVPLIQLRGFCLPADALLAKRVIEYLITVVLTVAALPVFAIVAVLIKLESEGPVLFKQQRYGRKGRVFTMYKFRSMYADAERLRPELAERNEKSGYIFKMKDDPRVTRVGRFIRRYSIDEMPQFFNILKGEMSLVGPRPLPVKDLADIESSEYGEWFKYRSQLWPGLTGLWQVSGRSETDFEDIVKYDLYYIQNWSLLLDLRIMLQTVFVVLKGYGAY